MEYNPHRHIVELEILFSYKNTALKKIESMGLSCPYVSSKMTYEQLFINEVQQDFNREESEYLKEGIICIFECLKAIECELPVTADYAIKQIVVKNKEFFEHYRTMKGFGKPEEEKMIFEMLQKQMTLESKINFESKFALSRELAEFKVRLNRIGINPVILNDEIEFSEESKNETEIEAIEIAEPIDKNPYPDIFLHFDAYVLFERWHSVFQNSKTRLADYSFIYRQMESDGLILEKKPLKFKKWMNAEPFKTDVEDMFKTYDNCKTEHKISLYKTLKEIR